MSTKTFDVVVVGNAGIDTNGAGDGLAVGFLSSFVLDGYSREDAILRGQITARHTCTQKASSSRLITKELLDAQFHRLNHQEARQD